MNKILSIFLTLSVLLSACTFDTNYGECIGAFDEPNDSTMKYETDTGNVILAVIFVETIIVPLVVLLSATRCPVGYKSVPPRKAETSR